MNHKSFESIDDLVNFVNLIDHNIIAVDTVAEQVVVAGDLTVRLQSGESFDIIGSTGNDGTYTVDTVVFAGGNTSIVVTGNITDSTADGIIRIPTIPQAKIDMIHPSEEHGRWFFTWWL